MFYKQITRRQHTTVVHHTTPIERGREKQKQKTFKLVGPWDNVVSPSSPRSTPPPPKHLQKYSSYNNNILDRVFHFCRFRRWRGNWKAKQNKINKRSHRYFVTCPLHGVCIVPNPRYRSFDETDDRFTNPKHTLWTRYAIESQSFCETKKLYMRNFRVTHIILSWNWLLEQL